MRGTLTKHKALETIGFDTQRLTQDWLASPHPPIADLFIELSGYSTQTAIIKFISEVSLTNYYAT